MRPTEIAKDVDDELPDSLEDASARTEATIVALRRDGSLGAQNHGEDREYQHSSREAFDDISHDPSIPLYGLGQLQSSMT
jgi:hypothetical protein